MNIKKSNKVCAACKYQRKKCPKDCPLAPYFPIDKPKRFDNVHNLFGVTNIVKLLKNIKDDDIKADAMDSIIFESDIRAKFPVHGCVAVIHYYLGLIRESEEELNRTQGLLAMCKMNNHSQQQNLHSSLPSTAPPVTNIPSFTLDDLDNEELNDLDGGVDAGWDLDPDDFFKDIEEYEERMLM